MNTMQVLAWQPWLERVGWTLVHFLWQGLSIAVLYAIARHTAARGWSPHARYLLACAALAVMVSAPLVTLCVMRTSGTRPDAYRIQSTPLAATTTRNAPTTIPLPASLRTTISGVEPAKFPALGRDGLAHRCGGVLGASGGRLGGGCAYAVDAGPACAFGMAGDPRQTRRADWSFSSCPVVGIRTGAGTDGGRLAASGGAGAGRGARRVDFAAGQLLGGPPRVLLEPVVEPAFGVPVAHAGSAAGLVRDVVLEVAGHGWSAAAGPGACGVPDLG